MDRISGLPDELLVIILSSIPTKVVVSTSILCKRWQFLWMWLPKLKYVSRHPALRDFIDKNLPLHRAPVIESLRLELRASAKPEDVKRWVGIAVSRYVRELEIIDFSEKYGNMFPSSFYTSKSLVTLKLELVTLKGVHSMACLPSLKTLQLQSVTCEESLQKLLSICPLLEELSVHFFEVDDQNIKEFSIVVPSLQSLSLSIPDDWFLDEYKIDTPSLKYFKLEDWSYVRHSEIKNMPKLVETYVNVRFDILDSVIGSITSAKRLTIRSESLKPGGEDVNGGGFVFYQLEGLKLKCSGSRNPFYQRCDDDDALTIAKSMPELRQLQLIGNKLTNSGLIAILDNCPHLEHLDLRKCWNIHLSRDLEKRGLEMVKEF